jgi:hypothetical protein
MWGEEVGYREMKNVGVGWRRGYRVREKDAGWEK